MNNSPFPEIFFFIFCLLGMIFLFKRNYKFSLILGLLSVLGPMILFFTNNHYFPLVLASIVLYGLITLTMAIYTFDSFSWKYHYLSDLGQSTQKSHIWFSQMVLFLIVCLIPWLNVNEISIYIVFSMLGFIGILFTPKDKYKGLHDSSTFLTFFPWLIANIILFIESLSLWINIFLIVSAIFVVLYGITKLTKYQPIFQKPALLTFLIVVLMVDLHLLL